MLDQLVGGLQVVSGALSWTFPDPLRRAPGGRREHRTLVVLLAEPVRLPLVPPAPRGAAGAWRGG